MSDQRDGFSFRPEFSGELAVEHVPEDFFARMERRVIEGVFIRGRRHRANYRVRSSTRDTLEFEAMDFLTAYNIGLNEVELHRAGSGTISYHVRFARWTRYAVIHGALLGATMAAVSFTPSVQRSIHSYRYGELLFWGMLIFWSLLWPWIMTASHRPFARRALERIVRDELAKSGASTEAA